MTNSVVQADLGAEDTVLVDVAVSDDRLAITVADPGSNGRPRLLARDPMAAHGLGLHLVGDISASWGARSNAGATEVWCELALSNDEPRPA